MPDGRKNKPEYAERALLEACVNHFIHRDYFSVPLFLYNAFGNFCVFCQKCCISADAFPVLVFFEK